MPTRAIAATAIDAARGVPLPPLSSAVNGSSRYRLLCEIGQGGMASVHLALLSGDAGFRKLVALKRAKSGLSQDPEFLEMFLNEARLAARLNHPNVVQTYEVGRYDAEPFIAMEFLEGQPLHRVQRAASSGIPLSIHLRIIAETLAGLHHAHELRDFSGTPLCVVHRDVSPQNVLVSYEGQAKVVDFGIAKAITHASFTELGLVKGKLHYMSPEQSLGEPLDRRADLFAIGVMLWEAGAGRRLWPGESARERLRLLSLAEIPSFDGPLEPAVAAELERICRRALQYSAARRYQTAAELEADLEALRAEPSLHATRRDVSAFMHAHFDAQRRRIEQLIEVELGHFSLNEAARAPQELAQGTRRVVAPVALAADLTGTTRSSMSPAISTLDDKPRAPRRLLGAALTGLVLVATLALVWHARSPLATPSQVTPADSVQAVSSPLGVASSSSTVAAPTAAASERAEHVTRSSLPVAPKRPGKAPSALDSAAPVGAASGELAPAPPSPPEAGMELSRQRPRIKRVTRALDTSDPWAN